MDNLKYIFIVYLPGYAGNFLARLLSLSKSTVPVLPIEMLKNFDRIPNLNIDQRLQLYSFKDVRQQYQNWQVYHREWITFYNHVDICERIDNEFSHIVYSLHFPEFKKFNQEITNIKNKEVFYVKLDLNRYKPWIEKSQLDLNFKYRLDEIENYSKWSSLLDLNINLTKILDNEVDYLEEYRNIQKFLNLDVYENEALILYKEWYDTRVRPYI